MPALKIYKILDVDDSAIKSSFNQLTAKSQTQFTAEDLVIKYYEQIKNARSMGYTFDEIATLVFNKSGCVIQGKELKSKFSKCSSLKKPKRIYTSKTSSGVVESK